jgi:hypothetical protein
MHQNSIVSLGNNLSTDAFLVVLHRAPNGKLLSYAIHNGSLLRSGEAVLYSSLLKADAYVTYDRSRIEFHANLAAAALVDFSTEESPGQWRRLRLEKGATKTSMAFE